MSEFINKQININEHGFNPENLREALHKMLGERFRRVSYQVTQLHGGTVGDVKLIAGIAETEDGNPLPYKIVMKTNKFGRCSVDHGFMRWRREYDLYKSDLGSVFTDEFRWPVCYLAEMSRDETSWQLWLEYIDGVSGSDLTVSMYEQAAYELGRFQGRINADTPVFLREFKNLTSKDFLWLEYSQYMGGDRHKWIRSGDCTLPEHLRRMIINMDDSAEPWFEKIGRLPVVFCHQDFWNTNIFVTEAGVRLIDWDTTGWGWLGEDIAALIADDIEITHMDEYYRKCIPAYYRGVSEYMDVSEGENRVREMILLRFGYRFVGGCMNAETDDEKEMCKNALQIIYDWGESNGS